MTDQADQSKTSSNNQESQPQGSIQGSQPQDPALTPQNASTAVDNTDLEASIALPNDDTEIDSQTESQSQSQQERSVSASNEQEEPEQADQQPQEQTQDQEDEEDFTGFDDSQVDEESQSGGDDNGEGFVTGRNSPAAQTEPDLNAEISQPPSPTSSNPVTTTPVMANYSEYQAINIRLTTVLKGESNLIQWKSNLEDALEALGLCKYIEKSIPEPAEEVAKDKWRKERAAVRQTIREKVDQQVINLLRNDGWDYNEKDPYVTYTKILKLLPEVSDTRLISYVLDFLYKKREDFNTLQGYLEHMIQLRDRLKSLKVDLPEKIECILLIKAVENILPVEVKLWKQQVRAKEMTWSFLMNKLMQEARDEQSRATGKVLGAVRPNGNQSNTQQSTTTTSGSRQNAADRPKVTCKVCNGQMPEGWKHCPNSSQCPKHIPGEATVCFYCHPDKCPPGKMKKRIEAWLAKQGTATTNILNNKESGLANPSRTVTFAQTTNHALDGSYPMTNMAFREGEGFPKSPWHTF
ncbi:hypothetical protein QBC37DRAFT_435753 [Rhypophila decipiens]|uniref:Gag protein n=1 Tax=Rhypophila decipiens TaxID=261697 RepID=A0AAN6XSI6_9PEZI|nr:hypothetical protein QBC37DRAFT_435753 [Rhypophila decipiens]